MQETPPPTLHAAPSPQPSPCKRLLTAWRDPDGSCRASACVLGAGSDARYPKPSPFSSLPPHALLGFGPGQRKSRLFTALPEAAQSGGRGAEALLRGAEGSFNFPCTCRGKPATAALLPGVKAESKVTACCCPTASPRPCGEQPWGLLRGGRQASTPHTGDSKHPRAPNGVFGSHAAPRGLQLPPSIAALR